MGFLFLLPGIVSVVMFVLLWKNDLLARPRLVGACCVTGLILQFSGSGYLGVWLAGLLINVGVALYLSIRLKLS
jgi:hypothetical protein